MSSPWSKIGPVEVPKLDDIMSEEFAWNLQIKECKQEPAALKIEPNCSEIESDAEMARMLQYQYDRFKTGEVAEAQEQFQMSADVVDELKSDEEIAKMLQHQYDREHDNLLKKAEGQVNKSSKVSVSFSNYLREPKNSDFESDSEEELVDVIDREEWDRFDAVNKQFDSIPACGYSKENGNIVTKHDVTLNSRRNTCKMMNFLPEINTGDGAQYDCKLPNNVFNNLKIHCRHLRKQSHNFQMGREERVDVLGVDDLTRTVIYKMMNNQLIQQVNHNINAGKKVDVFHVLCNENYEKCKLPREGALKVFRYKKEEIRNKARLAKSSAKNTVYLWAGKELANLCRMRHAGILCPDGIRSKQNVLLMSFIGDNKVPAPKLRDAKLSEADYIIAYDQVVEAMKILYTKARLIHTDLSEYNILWYKDNCYIISVSTAVERVTDNAFTFLMRDCKNVTHFFASKSVCNVATPHDLFKDIVGCDYTNDEGLKELQNSFKHTDYNSLRKHHSINVPEDDQSSQFDVAWKQIQKERVVDAAKI